MTTRHEARPGRMRRRRLWRRPALSEPLPLYAVSNREIMADLGWIGGGPSTNGRNKTS